ncbi:MAG TPA: GNAT family N-acetyltransferase [Casimicrobiaceae bacterium]|jgi:RimJ/RimL family protein N-acetyltransferase|nr:GNAT family N-acetyltransferase [Casimicrobiaceae bacterium]
MNVRRLTREDVLPYRQLMLDAYERHPDAFTSTVSERAALPMSWWQSRLSEAPASPDVVFGAFDDQRLIGVAGLSFQTREKARHKATLFGMYVPPKCRHRGVGGKLVRAALDYAGNRPGVMLVQLTVTQGNAGAQSLYEQCGFVAFGVEPYAVAVGDAFVAKVHMWYDLRDRARLGAHSCPASDHATRSSS